MAIYTGNIIAKNRRKRGEKEHPVELPRDVQYYWRMVRDSNPRTSCPVSGFQDRRIRPLCQPSETLSHSLYAGVPIVKPFYQEIMTQEENK